MHRTFFALFVGVAVAIPAAAFGQTLQDQINAVYQAQQQQEAAQRAAYDAALRQRQEEQAAILRQRREAQAALLRQHEEELALKKARIDAEIAEQRQKVAEAAADKKQDQAYEDRLCNLNIEREELELEALKARAARENDYINSDLAHRAAETNVIQSQADKVRSEAEANRNVSSGVKEYLSESGLAEVKKADPRGRLPMEITH
jgi:hypothetical protein